jgi:hypothetical protein
MKPVRCAMAVPFPLPVPILRRGDQPGKPRAGRGAHARDAPGRTFTAGVPRRWACGMAPWIVALGTTLLMQSVASFMTQTLPVIAPLITASADLAPERIGDFSSLVALGTVRFLLLGGAFLARLGPVRMLQARAVLAALALLVEGWAVSRRSAWRCCCWACAMTHPAQAAARFCWKAAMPSRASGPAAHFANAWAPASA